LVRAAANVPDDVVDQALSDAGFMAFARKIAGEQGFDIDALSDAQRRDVVRQLLVQISQQQSQS
jgi:hypothetical protein